MFLCFTFKPDHQRYLELQLSTGFGDAVGNDGTVDDPPKDVHQDGFNLWDRMTKQSGGDLETGTITYLLYFTICVQWQIVRREK